MLEEGWYWAAWVVWVPVFVRCIRKAPWASLKDFGRLHLWLGLIVILSLLWSMKAGVKPGLSLHLLGAMVMTLSCGVHLAFLGLCGVLAAITLNGDAEWFAFALNALLTAGVGVGASHLIFRLVDRVLPKHFFVYIFANGFFGSALAVMVVGLAASLFLAIAGAYGLEYLISEYLPYFLLLGFSEAWLSGMVMTLLVVYFPHWVATFDDTRYLANK
mgnify:CR=1 FL=1